MARTTGTARMASALTSPRTWNRWRIRGKVFVSRVSYTIILLAIAEAFFAANHRTLLDPYVAAAGLIWIATAVTYLWYRGGIAVDSLLGAAIVGIDIKKVKPGEKFIQAILLLGMINIFVTTFFLLVPFWKYPPFTLAVFVSLIGWGISSYFTKAEFKWKYVRKFYITMLIVMLAMIFAFASYEFIIGKEFSLDAFRTKLLASGVGAFVMIGVILLIIGLALKFSGRSLVRTLGGALIILPLLYAFFWSDAKASAKKIFPRSETRAAAVPTITSTVHIPACTPPEGQYVGIMVREGQQVMLEQVGGCTVYSIMGYDYRPWRTVSQRTFTYPIVSGGGLYLRPEGGRPATIRVTVN